MIHGGFDLSEFNGLINAARICPEAELIIVGIRERVLLRPLRRNP